MFSINSRYSNPGGTGILLGKEWEIWREEECGDEEMLNESPQGW